MGFGRIVSLRFSQPRETKISSRGWRILVSNSTRVISSVIGQSIPKRRSGESIGLWRRFRPRIENPDRPCCKRQPYERRDQALGNWQAWKFQPFPVGVEQEEQYIEKEAETCF